jgi:catechol 2,3-dioxygenase-like lactoylglutathione lyase family enzyme
MPLFELNHFFVRASNLERSRAFYVDALGFEVMPRPITEFPGYWLGVGGQIQLHMGLDGAPGIEQYLIGTTAGSARDNAGVIDHIAFQGSDADAMAQRLRAHGVAFKTRHIPSLGMLQFFVPDPDGLMLELNFLGVPTVPAWAMPGRQR